MKILVLTGDTPWINSGKSQFNDLLITAMSEQGHEVEIMTLGEYAKTYPEQNNTVFIGEMAELGDKLKHFDYVLEHSYNVPHYREFPITTNFKERKPKPYYRKGERW